MGATLQGQRQGVGIFAGGEHQHPRSGRGVAQAGQQVHATHARHMVVQQHHIGLQLRGVAQRLAGISCFCHHLQLRLGGQ